MLLLQAGAVFVVFGAAMWALRRYGRSRSVSAGGLVAISARVPLGKGSEVVVLRVGERELLLGVTEHQVSNLGKVTLTRDLEAAHALAAQHAAEESQDGSAETGRAGAPDVWARLEAAAQTQGGPTAYVIGLLVRAGRAVQAWVRGRREQRAAALLAAVPAGFAAALTEATDPGTPPTGEPPGPTTLTPAA